MNTNSCEFGVGCNAKYVRRVIRRSRSKVDGLSADGSIAFYRCIGSIAEFDSRIISVAAAGGCACADCNLIFFSCVEIVDGKEQIAVGVSLVYCIDAVGSVWTLFIIFPLVFDRISGTLDNSAFVEVCLCSKRILIDDRTGFYGGFCNSCGFGLAVIVSRNTRADRTCCDKEYNKCFL